jgi:hypothetical protein
MKSHKIIKHLNKDEKGFANIKTIKEWEEYLKQLWIKQRDEDYGIDNLNIELFKYGPQFLI